MDKGKAPAIDGAQRQAIADRIKAAAETAGISQAQIARELHLERQAVNHWFNARNFPGFEELYLMCERHKMSVDYIMFGRQVNHPVVVSLAERIAKMTPQQLEGLEGLFAAPADDTEVEKAYGSAGRRRDR